jgi:hypothetical protein
MAPATVAVVDISTGRVPYGPKEVVARTLTVIGALTWTGRSELEKTNGIVWNVKNTGAIGPCPRGGLKIKIPAKTWYDVIENL